MHVDDKRSHEHLKKVIEFLVDADCWDGHTDILDIKPDLTYDEAYLAQFASKRMRKAGPSDQIIGYQASLTSSGSKNMGPADMPKPNIGTLQRRNLHMDGDPLHLEAEWHLIECEVAMRLESALKGPGITAVNARAAVATVEAALEVVPIRYGMMQRSGQHLIATHNAGSMIVLSGHVMPASIDLVSQPVELVVDGMVVAHSLTGASGGDPFQVLADVANILGKFDVGLEAEMVILTGSSTAPYKIAATTKDVSASFGDLGTVNIAFA
jgi:2-keto-4-pentenoate hydratase